MAHRIGTGNWRSEREARRAYPLDYDLALFEGRVVIGKPNLKPGDRLLVDKQGRYHIEVP